jgi:hypothetical protein
MGPSGGLKLDGDLLAYSSMAICPFTGLFLVAIHRRRKPMAKLNEAERALLRAVLYLLRDSAQRAQVEIPTAGEARAAELGKNLQLAEESLEAIGKLLAN